MSRSESWCRGGVGLAISLLLVSGPGCHDRRVATLNEAGAYGEAMCQMHQRLRHRERNRALVAEAVDRSAKPRLHLAPVPAERLRERYGPAGAQLAEQAVLVEITVELEEVQVDDFLASVAIFSGPDTKLPGSIPEPGFLARLTDEVPEQERSSGTSWRHLIRQRWAAHYLVNAAHFMYRGGAMLFAPIGHLVGASDQHDPEVRYQFETDPQLEEVAPVAFRISTDAEDHSFARMGDHIEVGETAVWLRPQDPRGPLWLELQWAYGHSCGMENWNGSRSVHRQQVRLPDGPTLEARLESAFGGRLRPLEASEVGRIPW